MSRESDEKKRREQIRVRESIEMVWLFAQVLKIAQKPYRSQKDRDKLVRIENRFDWLINGE